MKKVLYYIKKVLIFIKVIIIVFYKLALMGIEWIKSDKSRKAYAILIFIIIILIPIGVLILSRQPVEIEVAEEVPPAKKIPITSFGEYKNVFNDRNDVQLAAARKNGIPEVQSRAQAETMKHKLVKIETNDLYKVDNLTHSIPYLVPKAKDMLDEIAQSFQDSLRAKGVDSYKIVVTSVLRSNEDVKKLRKVNVNASANSAHRHGTTIDIGYLRFERTNNNYPHEISKEELRHVLGEVLRDLRKQKKIYVKYEVKQGCFHITVR